ncbi:MAG: alpha/beta hydrolase [Gemmobacter sp.]|nr:alpha/beta hydrolase [Gemmobacter sp.]
MTPDPRSLDRAYANTDFISGGNGYVPTWTAEAARCRAEALGNPGIPYGPGDRQKLDLFLPDATPHGLVVFVRGRYWMESPRDLWSHLAAGVVKRGWACALPSYTLAPQARISAMTTEIAAAVTAAAGLVAGPVVITGHSAGEHLAARMGCADAPLAADVAARVRRIVPISPLADLEPIARTRMNDSLALDAAEIATESPAYLPPRAGCDTIVWVGGQERPAFLWQARLLAESWDCDWHVAVGRHHFDVIEDLESPDSDLVKAITGAAAPRSPLILAR